MPIEKEAVSFLEELQACYLEKLDFDRVLEMLDENATWIGPSSLCAGRRQAAQFFSRKKAFAAPPFQILSSCYQVKALTAELCFVYGILKLQKEGSPDAVEYCVSADCRLTEDGFRLLNLHLSPKGIEPPENSCSQGRVSLGSAGARESQEKLRLSLERFQIILDQANDIIFEWDLQADTLLFSSNWEKTFGCPPITDHVSVTRPFHSRLYSGDLEILDKIIESITNGVPYVETEVRIRKADGIYVWCRVRVTTQYLADGTPCKAVGLIINVDAEKQRSRMLLEKAERDTLTNLYNRETSRTLIQNYLLENPGETCALLMIDIDNFMQINSSLGHLFGDAFLIEISGEIQKLFRSADVVGRTDGDTFIAFIKGIPDSEVVAKKARQIVQIFQNIVIREKKDCQVTCTIGISLSPLHGVTFPELYQKAEQALYFAKGHGKNQFIVFDEAVMKDYLPGPSRLPAAVSELIDSDSGKKSVNAMLIEYVFRILCQSIDIESAVQNILEIAGKQFDVSRAYIFEAMEDSRYYCNTFEWCGNGVAPEKENLAYVPFSSCCRDNFNEYGIFYCRDVADLPKKQYDMFKLHGVQSMLQCAILDNGVMKGYVGFHDCRGKRFWTQEQVDALSFIAEIVSTFLLKKRAQDRALNTAESIADILDNHSSWICVVEPKTFKILYINKTMYFLAPDASLGVPCYKTFFHRDAPCENCPVKKLAAGETGGAITIHNPFYQVCFKAEASEIKWSGKQAFLISCYDITGDKSVESSKN